MAIHTVSDEYAAVKPGRRTSGMPYYSGEIRDVDRVAAGGNASVWVCTHKHSRISLAKKCAEAELSRR